MLLSILICSTLRQPAGSEPTSLLGRSLTWDPQGLVPFSVGYKLSDQDKAWIESLRQGEYAKVSAAAKQQCLTAKTSFFSIWLVAESARVRKDLSDLGALAAGLASDEEKAPFAKYASYRLLSLRLASTPSGSFQGKEFRQNPEYPVLVSKTHEAWEACRPYATKHLPIAVALATGREKPSAIRNVVQAAFEASPEKDHLYLWKARALLLGRRSFLADLGTGKPDRKVNGRPDYFFLPGDEPDLKGAEEMLGKVTPKTGIYLYYHARLLSWQAFATEKEAERRAKMSQAVAEIEQFLASKNQAPPLVESAKKFLKYRDPGAFTTSPTE